LDTNDYKYHTLTYDLINSKCKYTTRPYIKRWETPQKALEEALKREKEGVICINKKNSFISENLEKEKNIENKLNNYYNRKGKPKQVFGQPIDFRGLRFAPVNELSFMYLDSLVSKIGITSTIQTPAEAMEFSVFFGAADGLSSHSKRQIL
jgi:hypothetical protein